MRRTCLITLLLAFILVLTGCSKEGSSFRAKSIIGESMHFTELEIKDAILAVKEKFKDFIDCRLIEITYNEKKSDNAREYYLRYGKGSRKDLEEENVMVLFTRFEVGSDGINKSFRANTVYTNYKWTVIREKESGEWTVDAWGH